MAYATAAQLRAYLKIISPATFVASAAAETLTFTDVNTMSALRTDVRVTLSTTDTLPAPLAAATIYYVRSPTAMTCQLAATPAGAAINITDAGLGVHTLTLADNDDDLLTTIIARAQALIESPQLTDRLFEAAADTTRYFDARRAVTGRMLWLDTDLCAITSITNGDADVLVATEYTTVPKNTTPYYAIRLLGSSGLSWTYDDDPEDAIVIVGRWSYSTTAGTDVVQATLRLAAWLYRQRDTSADLDRPLLTDSGVTILPSAVPNDVAEWAISKRRQVLR